MTINQVLNHFKNNHSKIKLYFLHTNSGFKQIFGTKTTAIPTLTELLFQDDSDLGKEIDTDNILGLAYKHQNLVTNELELFFVIKIESDNIKTEDKGNWLTSEDIENNYTAKPSQVAALYAFGYLRCLRDKDEVSWYPVE